MKAVIIYYSKSGKTEKLANKIKASVNCEIIKVESQEKYGSYFSTVIRVIKEKRKKIIPQAITEIPNLNGYDVVFIGYPIWYQSLPEFFADFIKTCDLMDKTIIPFATFSGSGMKNSLKKLEAICINSKIEYPYACGAFKKDDYEMWLHNINTIINA